MRIAFPCETDPHEPRCIVSPVSAQKLIGLGLAVTCESGVGRHCNWSDQAYVDAGATVATDRAQLLANADLVARVRPPATDDLSPMSAGCTSVSYLDPFTDRTLVEACAAAGIRAISLEMVPRTTIAQKMDALSSQHSLAGYYMVVLGAERLAKVLPMMTTPAGTIQPARVFVIGAGVAGLQAIATAKRLGARVDAFDTRGEVKEQVQSLGGRFVDIDLGETGATNQGYAKALSDEQLARQRDGMAKQCAQSDLVITTAQLFGRPAPVVITAEMLAGMRPGSVVIDYAVESGGNVEGSVPGKEVDCNGVRVIGIRNYPGQIAESASQMLANNLANMLQHFWNSESATFDLTDEIAERCVITANGQVINPTIRAHYGLDDVTATTGAS